MDKPPLLLAILLLVGSLLLSSPIKPLEVKYVSLNRCVLVGYAHNWQQVYDIQKCESGYDSEVCNAEFGCIAGMGLWQIIPSTLKYCEKKLGRELDAFNAEDNNDCGLWLLENEGDRHWEMSKHCWELST